MDDKTEETEDGSDLTTNQANSNDESAIASTSSLTEESSIEAGSTQNFLLPPTSSIEPSSTENSLSPTDEIPIENTEDSISRAHESPVENPASPMDESSSDSTTATSKTPSTSSQSSQCDVCDSMAKLSVYNQRTATNGKIETIYKHYCDFCKVHFGLCSKKIRGVFALVTEEGRIMSNAEKAEYFLAERRKRTSTLSTKDNADDIAEPLPSTSNSSSERKNDDTDEGIDEKMEDDNEEEEDDDGEQEEEVEEPTEMIEQDVQSEELPQKRSVPRKKAKKHPFGGKTKRSKWTKRKPPRKDELLNAPDSSFVEVRPLEKEPVNRRSSGESKPRSSTPVEPKKRGRPFKNPPQVRNASNHTPSPRGSLPPTPLKCEVQADLRDFSCQTEKDLLLKSTLMEESYDQVMREGFGDQIVARLNDQPLILRKQFVAMLRLIQEQEKEISQFRHLKDQYSEAVKNLKEFGRSTRLAFSDEFREIRAHLLERKDEFNTHQAEMMSMFIKERAKYDAHKNQMQQKFEDHNLQYAALEAKVKCLEQENVYEKERAEYFFHLKEKYEKQKDSAEAQASEAVRKLNDRLWLGHNEKCSSCQATERQLSRMEAQVKEMETKTNHAVAERNDALEHRRIVDLTAKNLAAEVDKTRYERDTFKNTAERYKKEIAKLTQSVKDKEKELLDKFAEVKSTTPKSASTPRSVACTPSYTERITPPEDVDVLKTPPHASPHSTPTTSKPEKPLIQKLVEKKAPAPIASGFASWIPKEKINEPAPELPKAMSAFGVPKKTPQQKEAERAKYVPLSQPTSWERKITPSSTSDAFSEALAQAQSESFLGVGATASYTSRTYTEEMNRVLNSRKRIGEETTADPEKGPPSETPTPPVKKIKPLQPAASLITTTPKSALALPKPAPPATLLLSPKKESGVSSESQKLSKKIPKLSEKPPQAEFAPALGLAERSDDSSIPGLGMDKLDEKTKEKEMEELMKIKPAAAKPDFVKPIPPVPKNTVAPKENKQTPKVATSSNPPSNVKKINSPQKKKRSNNRGGNPWQRSQDDSPPQKPWHSQAPPHQQQYGIQTNHQRSYQMDLGLNRPWSDGPSRNVNGSLPWHRDHIDVPMQDTPFGKIPIQDTFGPRPVFHRPPEMPPQQSSFYGNPRDNNFYPPPRNFSPQPPPNSRMFSPPPPYGYHGPPNNGPRSFYN